MLNPNEIVEKILASKKYRDLYRPSVERIVNQTAQTFPPKKVEAAARNKLHQIWGAYLTPTDYGKLLKRIETEVFAGHATKEILTPALAIHQSTKERLHYIEDFYREIFAITGQPQTIVDYGCGFNLLTYPFMNTSANYIGIDINRAEVEFLNQAAFLCGFSEQAKVKNGDVLIDPPIKCDVSLVLKLLPVLDQQEKGAAARIIAELPSKFIVVSYPTKSIGGKEKGMVENYAASFAELTAGTNYKTHRLNFPGDLVFVIERD